MLSLSSDDMRTVNRIGPFVFKDIVGKIGRAMLPEYLPGRLHRFTRHRREGTPEPLPIPLPARLSRDVANPAAFG